MKLKELTVKVDVISNFGDRKTNLHLDTDDGVKHKAICDFMIFPSTGRDMIFGMPYLITDFGAVFQSTIAEARNTNIFLDVLTNFYDEEREKFLAAL